MNTSLFEHLPRHDTGIAEDRLRLVEAQARWEMAGVTAGIERYRSIQAGSEIDETAPAQVIIRKILPALTARIEALVDPLIDRLATATGGSYRMSASDGLLQALPADEQAVIALVCAMRGVVQPGAIFAGSAAAAVSIARQIAGTAIDQEEYRRWEDEKKAEAKETGEGDAAKRLRLRYPDLTREVWRKVRSRLDVVRSQPLPEAERVKYGMALLACLTEASPDFKIENCPIGAGRTEARLVVSEALIEAMNDRSARSELARPLLLPMICPPNDWRYE